MNVQPVKKEAELIAKSLIVKGTKVGEKNIIHLAEENVGNVGHSFEQGDVTVFSFKDGDEAAPLKAFLNELKKKIGQKFGEVPQRLERSQEKEVNYLSHIALA